MLRNPTYPRYAAIGARQLAPHQLKLCENIGVYMARAGWILHTGAAPGADQTYARGALRVGGRVVFHLPWPKYEQEFFRRMPSKYKPNIKLKVLNSKTYDKNYDREAFESVRLFHPKYSALKRGVIALHARNYSLIFPEKAGVVFTVAFPLDEKGGTMQGVRICEGMDITCVRLDQLTIDQAKDKINYLVQGFSPGGLRYSNSLYFDQVFPEVDSTLFPIEQGRTIIRQQAHRPEGAVCPCCGQVALVKSVPVTRAIVSSLYRLKEYQDSKLKYDYVISERIAQLMEKWKLIDKTEAKWMVTEKGSQFITGKIKIPKYAFLYMGTCIGYSDERVNVRDIKV